MVVKYNKNSNLTKKQWKNTKAVQCQYKQTYMYNTAWSRKEVNATKLVH